MRFTDFALIIRAISVLEGIALVGDPAFAIVDEAYPYVAKRLLTDKSPRLQAALQYMVRLKDARIVIFMQYFLTQCQQDDPTLWRQDMFS